jgi:NAD(P)H-hydrate epimerase
MDSISFNGVKQVPLTEGKECQKTYGKGSARSMNPEILINSPIIWQQKFPWPALEGNKYDRGHAIIFGGALPSTGAAKLAAEAALRIGAGLVSVACDAESLPVYAASFHAVMTKRVETAEAFAQLIHDSRVKAVLIGPGAGITERTKHSVEAALAAQKPAVLDADVFRLYANNAPELFKAIQVPCILTPHAGEFAALMGAYTTDEAMSKVRLAAQQSGAIVVLKGSHTLIAAPDGQVVVNENATPFLATAGSGDVLAGMATGLLAQGMPAFEAACAAVWLHAEAGSRFGPGLTADDLVAQLPSILHELAPASLIR